MRRHKTPVTARERKRGLPPDPDQQNADRARWALAALQEFQRRTGSENDTAVGDLLADLMHLCDRYPGYGPFAHRYQEAERHYDAETSLEGL